MASQEEVLIDADTRMQKSVEALRRELNTIRAGRATPALVENIMVDYYGVMTPLVQISTISVPEARVLAIQPWDKQAMEDVEKSILKSDMNLIPNNDGTVIRINIPTLTEERRKELIKVIGKKVEDGHVAIRNVRRDGVSKLRDLEKTKELSKDDNRRAQAELQRITDELIGKMDELKKEKEAEVMEV